MATITNLQGSTQIWNSDEIINQNFQNLNNAIVENTWDESIAGKKTFTDYEFVRDATNNTTNPNMRRLSDKWKVKNQSDAWGVEFWLRVDADSSSVWNRKRSLRWYLKKWATWVLLTGNELFAIEFDTYDGNTTYTSRTSIKTDSLYFNSQNWTGAWTSYTPIASWASWTIWAYATQFWKYKLLGKMCFFSISILVAKWTLAWDVKVSLPFTPTNSSTEIPVSWRCSTQADAPTAIKGMPFVSNNADMYFTSSFRSWFLQRSWLWTNVIIQSNWCYEIA